MPSRPRKVVPSNSARENRVIFEPVEPIYPAQSDLTLRYTLKKGVADNPLDWVGICKSGCRDIDNPITCQWAPVSQSDGAMTRERCVVFPAKFIQPLTDQADSYQFLYVSGSSHVLGVSQPFKVMDGGARQQLVGIQTHSPVAEIRDGISTNQEATSYVNISHELVSSDDEWELATNEELCKTNSSTSDLSDIEILSRSPSKEAVKIQPSGAGGDEAEVACEIENIKASSLIVDDAIPDYCSSQRHGATVSEVEQTSQYPSMKGVCEPELEIVEVKRKRKRSIKVGSEEEESTLDTNVMVKKSTKAKKLKQSSVASKKSTSKKSKKRLNAQVSEVKLQIKNSQIVNSESSTDNEDNSSVLLNHVRKRKQKNNTGKNKCHPAVHHNILMSSESDLENHQEASIKKAKRRRTRTKMEESVTPICNRLSLRQQDIFDCKTAEVVNKLNRIIEGEQMVTHTKREKEYDNSRLTDQSIKMCCKKWRNCDEDKIQVVTPCNLKVIESPDKRKVISRKIKKVDDSRKYQDTECYVEECVSPHRMYSRNEIDENIKYEMISHIPHTMEYQKNTPVNSKIPKNSEENRKHQVIPFSIKDLMSADGIMKYSGNDEIINYTVIPRSNESMKYPEKTTALYKLAGNIEGSSINNAPQSKTQNLIFGEETNYKKMNNIDANKRRDITKGNVEMVEYTQQSSTNPQALDNVYGRKGNDVSACNLKAEKTRNNSKLTSVIDTNCFQDDTANSVKAVELSKKVQTNSKKSKKCDNKLNDSVGLSEQKIKEGLEASKQKQVNQIKMPQIEEKDCRMFNIGDVGCERGRDGECGENRTELSGGFLWGTSSKETMACATPDDCVKAVKKKCLRKNKSRTKKGTSIKRQTIKSGDGIDVMLSDLSKMEEIQQNASLNIPATEDTENVSANEAEKTGSNSQTREVSANEAEKTGSSSQTRDVSAYEAEKTGSSSQTREVSANEAEKTGSSSQTREVAERGGDLDGNHVGQAVYEATCSGRPTFGITDGCMGLPDPGDLMAGSSPVDGTLSSGNQIRKEKPSQFTIRASQSKFKAKFKCQGRSSIGSQYLKRRNINKWRQLCRLLVINKRRFNAASSPDDHDDDDGDDDGEGDCTLVELENTECSMENVVTQVTSRAGSRPRVPDSTQHLHRTTNVALIAADKRLTYASVVKGTKQDPCLLHQEGQGHTVIEIPFEESYATTQDSAKCLNKNREGIVESEDISKATCFDFVKNPEVSNTQKLHKFTGLKFKNNPYLLSVGGELTCDVQPRMSGKLSTSRDPITKKDPEMVTEHCGSNKLEHAVNTSDDKNNVKMAAKMKDTINAVETLGENKQVVEDNLKSAHESPQEDVAEGDDVFLNWPLPTEVIRASLLKEHPDTGLDFPQKAERKAGDHCIFTKLTQAVAVASAWFDDQPQTDYTSRNIPVEESVSSEFELSPCQAGQTEVTESGAAMEGPGVRKPPETSYIPVTDDESLIWPLPATKSLSSKFGFGSVSEDQALDLSLPRDHFPHRRPALRNSLDIPWIPAPIQSQWSIPRTCPSSKSSEIKVAPGLRPKDHNSELVYGESKSDGESIDIRQRVNALDKLLEDLNSFLMQQRAQLHSGGVGDDMTAFGCSCSGRVKSMKHKRVSVSKSKGGLSNLTKSSIETVSVKPKVRIYKTQIAKLENQVNSLREALVDAARQPVKIHVKCKKLSMKIRDGKRAAKTRQATDGPVTMTWTQQDDEGQVSPSEVENAGLDQKVNSMDSVVNESHSEVGDGMNATPSQMGERYFDQASTLRSTSECPIYTHTSEVGGDELIQAATSPVQTDASSMGCPSPVYSALARIDYPGLRMGDRGASSETVSNEGDYLQFIPPRIDESRVTHTNLPRVWNHDMFLDQTFSRLGTPDLIPKTPSLMENSDLTRKALSNLGSLDPIPETSSRAGISDRVQKFCSRLGEYDQIREHYSRVGDRHRADSHSVSNDQAGATMETVRTFAALSNLQADKLGEDDHQVVSRKCPNIDAHQVSLAGMGDVPSVTSAVQDPAGYTHTHPSHYCSDCRCALHSCDEHTPAWREHSFEPNRSSPATGVTSQRHQNLSMSTNMSGGNHLRPVAPSFDHHPLTFSRPDSIPHSQYSHSTSTEKHCRHKHSSEMYTPTLQPMISCLHDRAHAVCQNPRLSFSHYLHTYTPQSHEINMQAHYQQPLLEANAYQHKLTMQNHDQDLNWDHVREGSSPWASITEGAFPKACCGHSANNVANSILDGNQTLQVMAKKNPTSSDRGYLSGNQPCVCHSPVENKHSSHISHFRPNLSRLHYTSREGCQERFSSQIPRLSSRVAITDSADIDAECPAFLAWSSPRKLMDVTTHSGYFIPSYSVEEKSRCSIHEESHTSIPPCSTSGNQSQNPNFCSCGQKIHDNPQYRNETRICSEKPFQKSEHDVHCQNQLNRSPLFRQHQIPAFEDINSPCPFQDPHVLQSNNRFISPLSCTDQHHYIEIQNMSRPCSSLSNPYQHYLQEDAHGVGCDHTCLNRACLSSISPTETCEYGSNHHHHNLQHPDPTVDQLTPTVGQLTPTVGQLTPTVGQLTPTVGQLTPTVGQLTPAADTIDQLNHRHVCNCFCFTDSCMQRRQIEESQPCPQKQSS